MIASRSIVVFYDSPCIDGASAAWAVNEAFKDDPSVKVDYVPLSYGKPEERTQKILNNVFDGAEVVFVDTSPKDDTLERLFSPNDDTPQIKKLTVIDHHVSEVARLKKFEMAQKAKGPNRSGPAFEFVLDAEKEAAAIQAWEHFNPGKQAPALLEWVGKMEPPVRLKTPRDFALAAFVDSKDILTPGEVFATIDSLVVLSEEDMVAQGNAILADQFNNIKKGIKHSLLYTKLELLPGHNEWVPIVNANVQNFGRRVNEALVEEASAGTTCGVAGAWHVQGDGTVKLSLRSKGVPDAGKISQHLGSTIGVGGGGHATDAVVQFDNLVHFTQSVPLYTREQMLAERWESKAVGTHTASLKRGGANGVGGPG